MRVVFGVTSSPFLLNGTIRYHCRNSILASDVNFIEKFLQDLYVDDSLSGANNIADGFEFYSKAKRLKTVFTEQIIILLSRDKNSCIFK